MADDEFNLLQVYNWNMPGSDPNVETDPNDGTDP